jgi:organic hydroperoxide reductase OsmC/OhrA
LGIVDDHSYAVHLLWQGSTGSGYRSYARSHRAVAPPATTPVALSADPAFRGDGELLNPEQLLVMAASSCQLLSFLALAGRQHIDVLDYEDDAVGFMPADATPMRITRIELTPTIRVTPGTDHDVVRALVAQAHRDCYIANSLTTDVSVDAEVVDA